MSAAAEWSKEAYSSSVSSRCWWYTPYDDGWIDGVGLAVDEELIAIVGLERELEPAPEWARELVEGRINFLPPCGLHVFPLPLLEILEAIGGETAAGFVLRCYAVDGRRKREAQDYCLCLDAWLAGAEPEAAARELVALACRKLDWAAVCRDLWEALGEHTEAKEALVELTLEALRYAIKASSWPGDLASEFGRDQYVGDYAERRDGSAGFRHGSSPRQQRLWARLAELCPGMKPFWKVDYGFWWLCAPKAFRLLERDLWAIGKWRALEKGERVPGFLQCEDTYPNQDEAAEWYASFRAALEGWLRGGRHRSVLLRHHAADGILGDFHLHTVGDEGHDLVVVNVLHGGEETTVGHDLVTILEFLDHGLPLLLLLWQQPRPCRPHKPDRARTMPMIRSP